MQKSTTMPRKPLLAAIIPAYNEAGNIAEVLAALRSSDLLDEIIVVDDGSTDDCAEQVRQASTQNARIRLIRHPLNKGKGQAVFTGWAATQATYLLLLDADLKNLTAAHVEALARPVISNQADMTLGLFWGGHIHTDLSSRGAPWLTGQRCLRAEILEYVSREAAAGYGFEVALTVAARLYGFRKHIVTLKGVWHPPSEFHRGLRNGIRWRARMYKQIIHALYITGRERRPDYRGFR